MHQIRVHLAGFGFPLLGDKLYLEGGQPYLAMIENRLDPAWLLRLGHYRLALHASSLAFFHPVTHAWMVIRAELPDDLRSLLG
jgi:23S rRNA pseudouridine955/2504/2580 synthase